MVQLCLTKGCKNKAEYGYFLEYKRKYCKECKNENMVLVKGIQKCRKEDCTKSACYGIEKGKALFETNCVTCHNPKGEGNIGPNLTDKNWIYGYDIKEVFKTIKTGTPNGMPEHNSKFNPVQIQQVASFVLSLPSAKGKDPQGEIIEK